MKIYRSLLVLIALSQVNVGINGTTQPIGSYSVNKIKISQIIKSSIPAVVSINAVGENNDILNPFGSDSFFSFFFGGLPPQKQKSSGSGVIIDANGYVLTCAHVIEFAQNITVTMSNGLTFKAQVILVDEDFDLAVLKIEPKVHGEPFPFLKVSEAALEVGDDVIAIGNSFGVGQTVTKGIISAIYRVFCGKILIQTDAPINPGNSGGPIITESGEVAGIANAIVTRSGAFHGVGFFIPANIVNCFLNRAIKGMGETAIPFKVQTADQSILEWLNQKGLCVNGGCTVMSAPLETGLKSGDFIFSVAGMPVTNQEMFEYFTKIIPPGSVYSISVVKVDNMLSDQEFNVENVQILAKEKEKINIEVADIVVIKNGALNGVSICEINPSITKKYKISKDCKGVIVVKVPKGNQFVKEGDIILELNGKNIKFTADLLKAIEKKSRGFSITIKRGNSLLQQKIY